MTGHILSDKRRKLGQYEEKLKHQIGDGDSLLGELGFGRRDLAELEELFRTEFAGSIPKSQTLARIEAQWPLTFALYLVLEGIYNYSSGNYWDGPSRKLGLQSSETGLVGRTFLNILLQHNLPVFSKTRGRRYVDPVLLHGGIPNDQLGAFFDFLWSNEKSRYRISLDAKSLIELWLTDLTEPLQTLPKPVQHFLEYGEGVAEDFVARCLDMFETDSLEESEQLVDLPQRVIRKFWEWRPGKPAFSGRKAGAQRIHLQRPVLTVAPYTAFIGLYLPPQQFPNRFAPDQLVWRTVADGHPVQVVNCKSQRIEGGSQFFTEQPLVISPAQSYHIHLQAGSETLKTWILPAFDDPPVLFFLPYDDYEGDALVDRERFRPGERWLLYPQEFVSVKTGDSEMLRDLPRLTGAWRGYRLELWKLAPGEMVFQGADGHAHCFTIIHEKVQSPPRFTGGNRLPLHASAADFPLYVGRPPSLELYTPSPHRWRLLIRAAGQSQPGEPRSLKLSQLAYEFTDHKVTLNLSQPELLGEAPFGRFEIVLRGPLGHSYQLGLRIIPELAFTGLDRFYLDNAGQTAEYQVVCSLATTIRQNPPRAGVAIEQTATTGEERHYTLRAQPEIQQINLQLRHENAVIPLTIPVRRLRWGLQNGQDQAVSWQTEPSSLYPGSLQNAVLWVDIPVAKENQLRVGWQLSNGAGQILRKVLPADCPVQHQMHCSLGELTAVWRERQETLCWQLLVQQPEVDEPLIVPAFYLLPTLDFGDLDYEWQTAGGSTRLALVWEHLRPGSYQLQLWPVDRPWIRTPLCFPLPDADETLVEWELTNDQLPPEAYLAELTVCNPWQSTMPERPRSGAPNTLLIKPPGLGAYYAEIARLRDQGQASVEQLLALFAHQFYNNQRDHLHTTNKAIADQREAVSLEWLARWLEVTREMDIIAYRLAQLRAFDATIIDRMVQESWPDSELDAYFRHMPDRLGEKICLWVVRSGLNRPRRACLTLLCSLSPDTPERKSAVQTAVDAVLQDVTESVLLMREGVDLLLPNAQAAAKCLARDGGLDAADLLQELTVRASLIPEWIVPGARIATSLGTLHVLKLRCKNNTARFCASLDDDCYVEGELSAQPKDVPVRLTLPGSLLHFTRTKPYQCQHCRQLFTSMADYSQHHRTVHSAQQRLRQQFSRDWSISISAVTLPDTDPATNHEEAIG